MRRILRNISHSPATSVCAALDGGRTTIAATLPVAGDGGFLPTDPKPNVRTPHTKPPTDIFGVLVGRESPKAWVVTARTQLKNEKRARKALGILFREYGGRVTQDEDGNGNGKSDEEKVNIGKVSEEELDVFLTNLAIECETDHEKYEIVYKEFQKVIEKMTKHDESDDELGDATRNDRVDKLAEIAEEELDAFLTNSFATKLMIECEPKYVKRFRKIIEKVRKKMIQDDGILRAFELVTNFMSRCEPDYEKLLCEVLEKVRENNHKIEKLDIEKLEKEGSFDEALVTKTFLSNLACVARMKPHFMAYEVIEKVAKKVGNENVRKIAEKILDSIVTDSFAFEIVEVHRNIPYYKLTRLLRSDEDDESDEEKVAKTDIRKVSEEELDIECETDHEKYEIVYKEFQKVIEQMSQDDELGDAIQNDRVDKLAEIAEGFVTNSFTTKLMIECEPKYEKRFREIIERVRKKMIQDDGILEAFELVTNLKCEPEYEKLLCEVLEKVREKITQDDRDEKGGNEKIRKIDKLTKLDIFAKLDKKAGSFETTLDEFVRDEFLTNLREVVVIKPYFMAYEVIEKVAKKVGNENLRKIVEKELDGLVTDAFVFETLRVQKEIPYFMYVRLVRNWELKRSVGSWNAGGVGS